MASPPAAAARKAFAGRSSSSSIPSLLAAAAIRSALSSAIFSRASFRRLRSRFSRGSSPQLPSPSPAFKTLRETPRGTSASEPAAAAPCALSLSSRMDQIFLDRLACHQEKFAPHLTIN
ncbi:uncharacterized protein LOC122049244 [Zingiber officinale]|uniref:uncharacterized protein LOC122049244 n=1 Tax=Zingiber officinale TaxID=94328 RepID=UPI001C4BBEA2|nr:uncharacterized protein LOC122049244 [Zingiber officinale]